MATKNRGGGYNNNKTQRVAYDYNRTVLNLKMAGNSSGNKVTIKKEK